MSHAAQHELYDEVVNLTPPGPFKSVFLRGAPRWGKSSRVLFYPNGEVRFEHDCKIADRTRIICAPLLTNRNPILSRDPLTIGSSLSCPDCDLHGWVIDGKWECAR